jgi:type II secretory pathway component PulF
MELSYKYLAKSDAGKRTEGHIEAPNSTVARARLKKSGLTALRLTLDWRETLHNLRAGDFDIAQLARLYTTLGRRIKNGKSMVEGLEAAAEYLTDPRLKQATLSMRQAILDGQTEHQAMLFAGFPRRDAMIIRSTAEAGRTGETFISLANERTRVANLRRSVKQVFFLPTAMLVFIYGFFFFSLWKIAPATSHFLKQTNLKIKMNAFNQAYFDFAQGFNNHLLLSTLLYFGVPVGIFLALRSGGFRRWLDRIPSIRNLSIRSDQAALWNSFGLLYDAAIPVREACLILADAAMRLDSRASFQRLSRKIDSGLPVDEAIQTCGFPSFIVAGVRSAASGGDLVAGIADLVRNLEEDVALSTEILKEKVKVGSVILVALGVLFTAATSYLPIATTVLQNV